MARERLPSSVRIRVGVLVGSAVVLAVLGAPLAVLGFTSGRQSPAAGVFGLVVGVVLPVLGLLAAWGWVRRSRRGDQPAPGRPNERAARVLAIGNPLSVAVAVLVGLTVGGWQGWVVAGVIALAASYGVVGLAQREDPSVRWRWFGRR